MITQFYRVRIDFVPKGWRSKESIITEVHATIEAENVESFGGNPACGPYIVLECDTEQEAIENEKKIVKIINKRGGKAIK